MHPALAAQQKAPGVAGKPGVLVGVGALAAASGSFGETLKGKLDIGGIGTAVGMPPVDAGELSGIGNQRLAAGAEYPFGGEYRETFFMGLELREFFKHGTRRRCELSTLGHKYTYIQAGPEKPLAKAREHRTGKVPALPRRRKIHVLEDFTMAPGVAVGEWVPARFCGSLGRQ